MGKDIFKDQRLLTCFVRQLSSLPDTPALIQFVAGEEDYLLLCSRIVNASAGDTRELQPLTEICRKNGLDFHVLKEKLTPVALALGLAVSSQNQSDHYELLGVPLDANVADIKKAFRKRVRKVHPDTSGEMTDSGREFIHLKAAYQILSDPALRQQYDETLQHVSLWKEKADQPHELSRLCGFRRLNLLISQNINPNHSAGTKIFYQIGGFFLLLIIVVFIFDSVYRQKAILNGDYTVKQKQTQEQKVTKEPLSIDSASKNSQNRSEVKSLRDVADNSRNIFNPGDLSQLANRGADTNSK